MPTSMRRCTRGVMAFKYLPLFGSDIGELIAKAESLNGR